MIRNDAARARILTAAINLLNRGGRDAVTTLSVAAVARVQAPTIYRLFEDMRGLLDAVADYGFAGYLKKKQVRTLSDDPLEDLRCGWGLHIQFGLSHQPSTN